MVRVAVLRKANDDALTLRSHSHFALTSRSFSMPSCLTSYAAELDEKIRDLVQDAHEDEETDTFAQRAETYYRKRPQLLLLLQDLYNAYVSLADRYSQSVSKHHQHLVEDTDCYHDSLALGDGRVDSDAESAISYQPQSSLSINMETAVSEFNVDGIIAQLIIKSVEYDLMEHELKARERWLMETSRKVELQKSLVEVLESERLILLNENARLKYKVSALAEENKVLASESMLMKRKAGELARCVLHMRDDHRVLLLSRKIEYLQGQIFRLERRNKEYYDLLVKKREHEQMCSSCKAREKGSSERRAGYGGVASRKGGLCTGLGGRMRKCLEHVRNIDFFVCGPRTDGIEPRS